ncbi:cysteine rich repeat-containing protein [Taklimakanibacter deserti]|uniref:cysteine rich repeat-containing protein n=1 Tax=Taklimakanibacter deserti TaxID=2267839 RepID=UPI000E655E94
MRTNASRRSAGITILCALLTLGALEASAQSQASPEMKAQVKAMARACRSDFRKFCSGVERGGGRVIACLQNHAGELSTTCRDALLTAKDKADAPLQ